VKIIYENSVDGPGRVRYSEPIDAKRSQLTRPVLSIDPVGCAAGSALSSDHRLLPARTICAPVFMLTTTICVAGLRHSTLNISTLDLQRGTFSA
ncbi:MAG TPA: hypothetical protein VGD59_10620, partial [Acidisarcina sp.]